MLLALLQLPPPAAHSPHEDQRASWRLSLPPVARVRSRHRLTLATADRRRGPERGRPSPRTQDDPAWSDALPRLGPDSECTARHGPPRRSHQQGHRECTRRARRPVFRLAAGRRRPACLAPPRTWACAWARLWWHGRGIPGRLGSRCGNRLANGYGARAPSRPHLLGDGLGGRIAPCPATHCACGSSCTRHHAPRSPGPPRPFDRRIW